MQALGMAQKLLQAGHITKTAYDALTSDPNSTGRANVDYASGIGQAGDQLISQYRPQSLEDEQRMNDMRLQNNMMNEAYNDRRRQSNFYNDAAIAEQANRATAASNVLNAYNNARSTTANFLSSLAGPTISQR